MNKFIKESQNKRSKNRPITFHYTNEQMVKDLIGLIPLKGVESVLDAGSGKNKVWFNNLPDCLVRYECELEDGDDFMDWDLPVDWVIGNPPFSMGWKFLEKASEISDNGIAFLGNINFFNCLTPKRLQSLKEKGFEISKINIVMDSRWFGRYYFIIFEKKKGIFSWNNKTYK